MLISITYIPIRIIAIELPGPPSSMTSQHWGAAPGLQYHTTCLPSFSALGAIGRPRGIEALVAGHHSVGKNRRVESYTCCKASSVKGASPVGEVAGSSPRLPRELPRCEAASAAMSASASARSKSCQIKKKNACMGHTRGKAFQGWMLRNVPHLCNAPHVRNAPTSHRL